jgi:hypothetical protein
MAGQAAMAPSDIRFTQDSVSEEFGRDTGKTIEETYRQLLHGDLTVNQIRPISVVYLDDKWWAISGNRRLYIFKRLEGKNIIDSVPVKIKPLNVEKFLRKRSTRNDGEDVRIREDRNHRAGDQLADRLDDIYNDWLNE